MNKTYSYVLNRIDDLSPETQLYSEDNLWQLVLTEKGNCVVRTSDPWIKTDKYYVNYIIGLDELKAKKAREISIDHNGRLCYTSDISKEPNKAHLLGSSVYHKPKIGIIRYLFDQGTIKRNEASRTQAVQNRSRNFQNEYHWECDFETLLPIWNNFFLHTDQNGEMSQETKYFCPFPCSAASKGFSMLGTKTFSMKREVEHKILTPYSSTTPVSSEVLSMTKIEFSIPFQIIVMGTLWTEGYLPLKLTSTNGCPLMWEHTYNGILTSSEWGRPAGKEG